MTTAHISPDDIRALFSRAVSDMYQAEVPQYGALLQLVADVNEKTLRRDQDLKASLEATGELDRLGVERHGAIRLGTAEELAAIRRVFAVMGMHPVGYYDLSVAGVPVHSTAFRPIDDAALRRNPFRVFTSLLRLELIEDEGLRAEAAAILARRQILTTRAMALVEAFELQGGLTTEQADAFVREVLETFRWRSEATVTAQTYKRLHDAHRLIADVVSFKGPHINHLTPRTLDIDEAQAQMPKRGITPKEVIEGPPRRSCPILLRQTSFKALEEAISFPDAAGGARAGTHTARFGEIEQRGAALTSKGRKMYDDLLARARCDAEAAANGANVHDYETALARQFKAMPEDWPTVRAEGLAFFRYSANSAGAEAARGGDTPRSVEALIARGCLRFDPIIYEDFLPVSAAGIFQSNLAGEARHNYAGHSNRRMFEEALGRAVLDEFDLYARAEKVSLAAALAELGVSEAALTPSG